MVAALFLDVDGVLNVPGDAFGEVNARLLRNLARVLRATGARVVLSSSWRLDVELDRVIRAALLSALGEDVFIGITPQRRRQSRANEIVAWLHAHAEERGVDWWAAVDDMDLVMQDPASMVGHAVQTDQQSGLTVGKARELEMALRGRWGPSLSPDALGESGEDDESEEEEEEEED